MIEGSRVQEQQEKTGESATSVTAMLMTQLRTDIKSHFSTTVLRELHSLLNVKSDIGDFVLGSFGPLPMALDGLFVGVPDVGIDCFLGMLPAEDPALLLVEECTTVWLPEGRKMPPATLGLEACGAL